MNNIILFHGLDHIIKQPLLKDAKSHNDYGSGFYCTEIAEMAKEWACKNNKDGFINQYKLNTAFLKVLNLMDGEHSILNWIALLLANCIFALKNEIAIDAKPVDRLTFYPKFLPRDIMARQTYLKMEIPL